MIAHTHTRAGFTIPYRMHRCLPTCLGEVSVGVYATSVSISQCWLSRPSYSSPMRGLSTIVSILLIVFPIRYALERLKPFENRDRNPSWVQHLRSLKAILPSNAILFNTTHPIESMFYTDIIAAYSISPDQETIERLLHLGYRLFLVDGEQLKELVLEKEMH